MFAGVSEDVSGVGSAVGGWASGAHACSYGVQCCPHRCRYRTSPQHICLHGVACACVVGQACASGTPGVCISACSCGRAALEPLPSVAALGCCGCVFALRFGRLWLHPAAAALCCTVYWAAPRRAHSTASDPFTSSMPGPQPECLQTSTVSIATVMSSAAFSCCCLSHHLCHFGRKMTKVSS